MTDVDEKVGEQLAPPALPRTAREAAVDLLAQYLQAQGVDEKPWAECSLEERRGWRQCAGEALLTLEEALGYIRFDVFPAGAGGALQDDVAALVRRIAAHLGVTEGDVAGAVVDEASSTSSAAGGGVLEDGPAGDVPDGDVDRPRLAPLDEAGHAALPVQARQPG